jgi:hypothetical protein
MGDINVIIYCATWNHVDGREMDGPGGLSLAKMINTQLVTPEQMVGMCVGDTKTVSYTPTKGPDAGWHTVTISMESVKSYLCNCCKTRQPGDGVYDICDDCGWENEPGETQYPDTDGGPNHMSLNEGITNFKKYNWYAVPCKGCQVKEGHGSWRCRCDWPSFLPMKEDEDA